MKITERLEIGEILVVPGNWKNGFFIQETYHFKNFRYEILKSFVFEKWSLSNLPHFLQQLK